MNSGKAKYNRNAEQKNQDPDSSILMILYIYILQTKYFELFTVTGLLLVLCNSF